MLLVLCLAGFLLGQIQNRSRNAGVTDPITATIRSLVIPVASPLGSASRGTGDFTLGLFSGGRLAAENRRLKAELLALSIYSEQIADRDRQIDDLRIFGKFGEVPGKVRVPASVIAIAPYENLVTLNVGSKQGVKAGNPVAAARGLLGTVLSVEENRCLVSVVSASNRRLTLGAIDISRKPPPAGLLNRVEVTFESVLAPVQVGDMIVTSGFSEMIPRGIIIGRVISVEVNDAEGTKRATIDPAVSLGTVGEVHVLR